MGLSENMHLHVAGEVECQVHPVVLFSIVDHYSRRETGQERVIGTLLGTETDGKIEVCSGFPVPHTETDEQVAVNTDFHATMLALHQRVYPKQKVVGWYSTGEEVNESSLLFHEFYGQDVERPVHLLLDLGLGDQHRMSCKAYISKQLSLGSSRLGTSFIDIQLTVVSEESDRVGIDTLMKSASGGDAGAFQMSEADSMEVTIKKLLRTIEGVGDYVDKVSRNEVTPDATVIQLLQTAMTAAPNLPSSTFDKIFDSQVQDMLVVVYLANLTRAQLALSEKLQSVAISNAN